MKTSEPQMSAKEITDALRLEKKIERETADELGWIPYWPKGLGGNTSYKKGVTHIWQAGQSNPIKIWAVCADLLDNRYQNHRRYDSVAEALRSESYASA